MKFFAVFALFAFFAVAMAEQQTTKDDVKPKYEESVAKTETVTDDKEGARDKRGLYYAHSYGYAPVAYTASYGVPYSYTYHRAAYPYVYSSYPVIYG